MNSILHKGFTQCGRERREHTLGDRLIDGSCGELMQARHDVILYAHHEAEHLQFVQVEAFCQSLLDKDQVDVS